MGRADPDSGCRGECGMLRVGRDLTATHHLPPTLSQSNSIPKVCFVTLLPQGAFSDPACSNRPESLFHFQTEAVPEHSNPFALAEQLVTPAVSSPSIVIILIPNVCCTDGDHYHPHFPPVYQSKLKLFSSRWPSFPSQSFPEPGLLWIAIGQPVLTLCSTASLQMSLCPFFLSCKGNSFPY